MNRREFFLTAFAFQLSSLQEYCFDITSDRTIGVLPGQTTAREFLQRNANAEAAINGPYFDPSGRTQGLAYYAGKKIPTAPSEVRGYFTVSIDGKMIDTSERIENVDQYWLVLGSHPLLISQGSTLQASEARYNLRPAFRSAIGTKDNRNICFAVSNREILMRDWAGILLGSGYRAALNLDGGPVSQMAQRTSRGISAAGGGSQATRLIIFSYRR
jgi:exopolysaccharide biosynthesis protein